MGPNITAYKPVADSIINELVNGSLSGMAWNRLANMTDTYGSRICGSESLENSIDWVIEQLKADGFQNVTKEKALVPHWVRGEESLIMLQPRNYTMGVLGLGTSIGTNGNLVVKKKEKIIIIIFEIIFLYSIG